MMLSREYDVVYRVIREAEVLLGRETKRPDGPRGQGASAEVDVVIATLLGDRLHDCFPQDSILGEDIKPFRGTSGRAFIIDPVDGTQGMLRGLHGASTSIALVQDGKLLMGFVSSPRLPDALGGGALRVSWAAGQPLREAASTVTVSAPARVAEFGEGTRVLVSAALREARLEQNRQLIQPATIIECTSIATRLALVAVGCADVAVSVYPVRDWDLAAGQALIRASGGDLLDDRGEPIKWSGSETTVQSRIACFGARDIRMAREAVNRFSDLLDEKRNP